MPDTGYFKIENAIARMIDKINSIEDQMQAVEERLSKMETRANKKDHVEGPDD